MNFDAVWSFQLAEAGFYHCPTDNEPDVVKCYVCLKELDGWAPEDDPWYVSYVLLLLLSVVENVPSPIFYYIVTKPSTKLIVTFFFTNLRHGHFSAIYTQLG